MESFLIFNFFDETIGVSKVSLETGGFFKGLKKWFYFKTIEKGISLISIQEFCRRPLVLKFQQSKTWICNKEGNLFEIFHELFTVFFFFNSILRNPDELGHCSTGVITISLTLPKI